MKTLFIATVLIGTIGTYAQTVPAAPMASPAQVQADLQASLAGDWVGVLEYRDYAEPATSLKREVLPTWLSIQGQTWHITYDDGPNKVLEETDIVAFDPANNRYSEIDNDKPAQIFKVTGYDKLQSGRGVLVLVTNGTDNDKPAERRITFTIRRNLLEMLEEVRPAGSTEPFVYRHALRFTRANHPTVTAKH